MNKLFFWNKWPRFEKSLYLLGLFLFVSTLCYYLFSQLLGKDQVLGWNVITEVNSFRTIIDTFQKGFFDFSVDVPNQYLVLAFEGAPYPFNSFYSWYILGSIGLLIVSGCVAMTYVKGLWYYLSLFFLGLFVYFLHFDVLQAISGGPMYWPVLVFLTLGLVVHVFHDFVPHIEVRWRIVVFILLTAFVFYTSISLAKVEEPVLYLVAYGWMAPFGLSLVYIFMVSSEIYQAFLFVATDSKHAKPSSSLINLALMSLLFMGNLLLTLLKNGHHIDWDLIYLEAPLVLVVSAILGIWGNKKREPIYTFITDFNPTTAFWHLVMAINCFVCYAYVNMTGNDPLQEVFEDAIVFSQLTIGVIFLLFIFINFAGYLSQNLPVHAIVYRPKSMPFGFVRIISAIGVFAIVLYHSNYQYRQAMSGYYLGIADVYARQYNDMLAKEYYLSALDYDQGGYKANYSLAMLAKEKPNSDILVKTYLKQASFKEPKAQSYASLGQYLLASGDVIRSLETLREGKSKFPNSPEILNNIGLAFSHTNIHDSTIYYFEQAMKHSTGRPVAATNKLAFQLKYHLTTDLVTDDNIEDLAYRANVLAVQNKIKKTTSFRFDPKVLEDSSLGAEKMAYILNLANNLAKDTSLFKSRWLDSLAAKTGNERYSEKLSFAKALTQYYGGYVAEGIISLDQLQATGSEIIRYNNILSHWLVQQDAPRVAMDFLDKAKQAGDRNTCFGLAIASSFCLPANEVLPYWKDPELNSDPTFRLISMQLQQKAVNVYKLGILPQAYSSGAELAMLFGQLPVSTEKTKALSRVMEYLNEMEEPVLAIKIYKENEHSVQSDWEYLRALKKSSNKDAVSRLSQENTDPRSNYLLAWSLEESKPKEAIKLYAKALSEAPLYEEGVVDAIHFLKSVKTQEEIYELLLQSVMLNQYSIPIQKAYATQCVEMNLLGFADYSVGKLKDLMPKLEYNVFVLEINKMKDEATNKIDWK